MARLVRCRLQQIAIQGDGFGRAFGNGAVVDLDELLPSTPPMTVEEALGDRIAGFEPMDTPPGVPPGLTPDDGEE